MRPLGEHGVRVLDHGALPMKIVYYTDGYYGLQL